MLVSELMLQQTPVNRVLPVYRAWLDRWPTPAALAAASTGDAVRMWGKLGYPRRALRLHGCAVAITEQHGGQVPDTLAELLALPGVGDYTARAVLAFAFGRRAAVVDINVRRVLARAIDGQGHARAALDQPGPGRHPATVAGHGPGRRPIQRRDHGTRRPGLHRDRTALRVLPGPVGLCLAAGRLPGLPGPHRATAAFHRHRPAGARPAAGRAARGRRAGAAELRSTWPGRLSEQRRRALDSLVVDGLIDPLPDGRYALPS